MNEDSSEYYVIQEAVSEKFEVPYGHSLYNFEEPEHQSLVLVEGRSRKIKATWFVLKAKLHNCFYDFN